MNLVVQDHLVLAVIDNGYHINIASEGRVEFCLVSLDSHSFCSINAYDLYLVSWLALINKIIIDYKVHCCRCLSFRNLIRSFLKFNILFVSIGREIVYDFKCEFHLAIVAFCWLIDSSSLKHSCFRMTAIWCAAFEVDFLRLWLNI